jgi:hypothetical protein
LEVGLPSRARRRAGRVALDRFWAWCCRRWPIGKIFDDVPDGRVRPTIPLPAVLTAMSFAFVLRLGSVRGMDKLLAEGPGALPLRSFLKLPKGHGISDDTFGDALAKLGPRPLRKLLLAIGSRELQRWKAGRYQEAILSRRILAISPAYHWLASRVLVAIDGHELFASEHRHCPRCLTRKVTKKVRGEMVEVVEFHHKVVVAQWVGTHPVIVLEFEELRPGDNELLAAYRLMIRLGKLYGPLIDVLTADALYDGEPFRALCRKNGYYWVIRQKNEDIYPGKAFRHRLEKRDPALQRPDWKYTERASGRQYEVWEEREVDGYHYRFVLARRTSPPAKRPPKAPARGRKVPALPREPDVHKGACLTDLPAAKAPAVAVAMIMETRWWIEDTGFHELADAWGLDHQYVHAGRSVAVTAILILAFVAYNAMQAFFYRELGISPLQPDLTFGDVCRYLLISIGALDRKAAAHAPGAQPAPSGQGWPPGPDP